MYTSNQLKSMSAKGLPFPSAIPLSVIWMGMPASLARRQEYSALWGVTAVTFSASTPCEIRFWTASVSLSAW